MEDGGSQFDVDDGLVETVDNGKFGISDTNQLPPPPVETLDPVAPHELHHKHGNNVEEQIAGETFQNQNGHHQLPDDNLNDQEVIENDNGYVYPPSTDSYECDEEANGHGLNTSGEHIPPYPHSDDGGLSDNYPQQQEYYPHSDLVDIESFPQPVLNESESQPQLENTIDNYPVPVVGYPQEVEVEEEVEDYPEPEEDYTQSEEEDYSVEEENIPPPPPEPESETYPQPPPAFEPAIIDCSQEESCEPTGEQEKTDIDTTDPPAIYQLDPVTTEQTTVDQVPEDIPEPPAIYQPEVETVPVVYPPSFEEHEIETGKSNSPEREQVQKEQETDIETQVMEDEMEPVAVLQTEQEPEKCVEVHPQPIVVDNNLDHEEVPQTGQQSENSPVEVQNEQVNENVQQEVDTINVEPNDENVTHSDVNAASDSTVVVVNNDKQNSSYSNETLEIVECHEVIEVEGKEEKVKVAHSDKCSDRLLHCLSQVPCASLIAWIILLMGLGGLTGSLLIGVQKTRDILDANELLWFIEYTLTGVVVGMFLIGTALLCVGHMSTDPTSRHLFHTTKRNTCAQVMNIFMLVISYILGVAWTVVTSILGIPMFLLLVLCLIKKEVTCVDLVNYGLHEKKFCGDDLADFAKQGETLIISYIVAYVSSILIVISLVHFMIVISANISGLKDRRLATLNAYAETEDAQNTKHSMVDTTM